MIFNPQDKNPITYFAKTNFRDKSDIWGAKTFGIKQADRLAHLYAIGKTGTGKTTLLETLIRQDIESGKGIALIDPHGDLVERIAENIPAHRKDDLVYFNVPDASQPWGYNPLKHVRQDKRPLAASGLLEVFKKMWDDSWGPRMEHIIRNSLLALLDMPDATLPDILRMLIDEDFRKKVALNTSNQQVKDFWLKEYAKYSYRYQADANAPIQNKVGAFLADPEPQSNINPTRKNNPD